VQRDECQRRGVHHKEYGCGAGVVLTAAAVAWAVGRSDRVHHARARHDLNVGVPQHQTSDAKVKSEGGAMTAAAAVASKPKSINHVKQNVDQAGAWGKC
jgi:hypothetical protein